MNCQVVVLVYLCMMMSMHLLTSQCYKVHLLTIWILQLDFLIINAPITIINRSTTQKNLGAVCNMLAACTYILHVYIRTPNGHYNYIRVIGGRLLGEKTWCMRADLYDQHIISRYVYMQLPLLETYNNIDGKPEYSSTYVVR